MASGPITSWKVGGEKNGNGDRLYFLGLRNCSREIKRCLLLVRKAMTNLVSILKSRDITLLTKVHLVKAMVFPVVLYGCESWTIKKAEHWKIDAFELRCSVLGVLWKDWCWSWISNTLATWCKELTHLRRPWCWEKLMAGGEGVDRGFDVWMASPMQWTRVWGGSGSWWWTGKPGVLQSMGSQRVGHDWATKLEVKYNFNKIVSLLGYIHMCICITESLCFTLETDTAL